MTDKEHALIMMMFTRQTMYIQMLIDMLKSKEIIQGDDVPAFDFAVRSDPDSVSLLREVAGLYRSFANQLGMEIPKFPPTL
jgi:isopentenyl phosphate kinase